MTFCIILHTVQGALNWDQKTWVLGLPLLVSSLQFTSQCRSHLVLTLLIPSDFSDYNKMTDFGKLLGHI